MPSPVFAEQPLGPNQQNDEKGEEEGQCRPGRTDPGADKGRDHGQDECSHHRAQDAAHPAQHHHRHQHGDPFPVLGRKEAEHEADQRSGGTGEGKADGEGER